LVVAYPGTEVARQSVISYVDAVRAEFTRVAEPSSTPMPDTGSSAGNLAKSFGRSRPALPAFAGVSFTVARASVCALLGHNGAGKTTTINIRATLVRPTAGVGKVAGFDVERQPPRSAQYRGDRAVRGARRIPHRS